MAAVLGMAALRQSFGIEVGLAAELGYPFRDPIRMLLFLAPWPGEGRDKDFNA